MKSLLIGTLSLALAAPAFAGAPSASTAASEKFGSSVQLNYTAVAGVRGGRAVVAPGAYRGRYARGAYGYRGPYRGGYYPGRYGYRYGYGYRYPYWGGYYGYPYAAAFAFGVGLPLAYSAGYYASAPGFAAYQQPVYQGQIVAETAPGRIAPSTGGTAARSVQAALQNRGYYTGPIDGEFGPESQAGIARFQQANGLKVTGLINSSTLRALNLK
jgi:hypothetical protein